jgi:hypothetical protein
MWAVVGCAMLVIRADPVRVRSTDLSCGQARRRYGVVAKCGLSRLRGTRGQAVPNPRALESCGSDFIEE